MRAIRSPLIFVDRVGEVAVFDSPEHAEATLAAIDVQANQYRAFSSTGVRLQLQCDGLSRWRAGWVTIDASDDQADGELRRLLIEFGVRHGAERQRLETLELAELIDSLRPGA